MSEDGDPASDLRQVDLETLLLRVSEAEDALAAVRAEIEAFAAEKEREDSPGVRPTETITTPTVSQPPPFEAVSSGYRISIEKLFHLASSQPMEAEALEASLSEILHSSAKPTPRSVKMLVRFPWTRFMKSWSDYLNPAREPSSFEVVRTNPKEIGSSLRAKVFLAAPGKQPSPIELARDDEHGSAWGIVSFSL